MCDLRWDKWPPDRCFSQNFGCVQANLHSTSALYSATCHPSKLAFDKCSIFSHLSSKQTCIRQMLYIQPLVIQANLHSTSALYSATCHPSKLAFDKCSIFSHLSSRIRTEVYRKATNPQITSLPATRTKNIKHISNYLRERTQSSTA